MSLLAVTMRRARTALRLFYQICQSRLREWRAARLARLTRETLIRYSDLKPEVGQNLLRSVVCSHRREVVDILAEANPVFREQQLSLSQEGEDLILQRLLAAESPGFFVDVGAHHPYRFSNTYLLSLKGWRGINIDATPGSMHPFEKFRPDDANVECMVGLPGSDHVLFLYDEPALNTSLIEVVQARAAAMVPYKLIGKIAMKARSLSDILNERLPPGQPIGLLNIDVEGAEMAVLRSNDWHRFRPKLILVEQVASNIADCINHPTSRFLSDVGYEPIAKTYQTTFFKECDA
jgi:FkbM family methyltransferase